MLAVDQRLLVIDNNADSRDSMVSYLVNQGYQVYSGSSIVEGLALYEQYHPDLVLCDLNVADLSSGVFAPQLVSTVVKVPIIVISDSSDMNDVVAALRFGAKDYLIKPFIDNEVLDHAIQRCFEFGQLATENDHYRQRLEAANLELQHNLALLKQDHKAGRRVQFKMLPETPKRIDDYQFSQRIFPSLYLSGDFIDYFTVGEENAVFFIADVSGHGASSAFVTVLLKNLFARKRSDYSHRGDRAILSPLEMLRLANSEILDTAIDKHMTMCIGVLHLPTGELRYSNAGHLPQPILVAEGTSRFLPGDGMPVGLFDEPEFNEETILLPEDFVLTLFSDGILEILPVDGLQAQEAFLLNKLQGAQLSAEALAESLEIQHITEFPDDIAVLLVSKKPRK